MPLQLPLPSEVLARVLGVLRDGLNTVPRSSQPPGWDKASQARRLSRTASLKAAAVSGTLALPPGPAGLLTILPDLALVWKIQGQMVADIAAVYGKAVLLTREGMIHCLFKHAAAQAVRGMVVRAGQGILVRRASAELLNVVIGRVGVSLTERIASKALSRWIPVLGAVGVGAYAFYDTRQIAETAVDMFESEVAIED